MAIRIIVDSASDILPEEAKQLGIVHVPMKVIFDTTEYLDGVTLSHKEFYEKLIESDTLPKTSQATPGEFGEALKPVMDAGDTAIIITVSEVLSGTYQSACLAASEYPGRAFVVDSRNVCLGERLLVLRALELIQQGLEVQEILDKLNKEKNEIKLLAVLDTLEYLKKGGRIPAAVAFAGGVLSIKPVVNVKDGNVVMCGKARGSKNANNLLRKMVLEGGGIDFDRPHTVAYSGLSDHLLNKYMEDNADLWRTKVHNVPYTTVGCIIGTHVGPGAIGVAYFEKNEK